MVVLVTRPSPMGEDLVLSFKMHGRDAYHFPLITFSQGRDLIELPQWIKQMRSEDLIFVVSKTAISYLASFFKNNPVFWPHSIAYYAIGRNTTQAWQKINPFQIRYPVNEETTEGLLSLINTKSLKGKTALILRGNGGRELLGESLQKKGGKVIYCECYQRHLIHYDGEEKSAQWQLLKIDTIIVTSEEMLKRLYALVPKKARLDWLVQCRLFVISARVADVAADLGWHQIYVTQNADNQSLLNAVLSI